MEKIYQDIRTNVLLLYYSLSLFAKFVFNLIDFIIYFIIIYFEVLKLS